MEYAMTAPNIGAFLPVPAGAAYGHGPVQALTDGATVYANLVLGSMFSWTIGGNRTLEFFNPQPGQQFDVLIKQDGTGSRLVTFTDVLWASGTPPTLTTTASATDWLRFTYNDVLDKYLGETVAKAIA